MWPWLALSSIVSNPRVSHAQAVTFEKKDDSRYHLLDSSLRHLLLDIAADGTVGERLLIEDKKRFSP